MTAEQSQQLKEFALYLTAARIFVTETLRDDDLLSEFEARDVRRADLLELANASERVAQVFYNDARPV